MGVVLHGDRMTPKERIAAFATGKEFDRLPCFLSLGETATSLIGKTVAEYHHSPRVMADVDVATYRLFGQDGVGVGPGFHGIAEAMGTGLCFPDFNVPYIAEPVVRDYDDIDRLEPADPYRDGRLPLFLEATQLIIDELGDEVNVGSGIGGPFSIAACLRGTEYFLRDLRKNPEAAHRLLRLATESALRYIDAVSELGIAPGFADPVASGTVISAAQFREFAQPYLKICTDRINEKCGKRPNLHICGDTSRIWTEMADTGAATLSLDNIVDLAAAKEAVGNRVCLMGNVSPAQTLHKGTPADVEAEARSCIRKAYDSPKGYFLAAGCQIPIGTPVENIKALIDTARIYGKWPIAPERLNP
ncbi:MAG: uroporphyrinogen decarboxylase family protein [Thermacetogeniaceae bacterium]